MTLLGFLKLSCAVIFVIYLGSVNLFKRGAKTSNGSRPEPDAYTFFPKKGKGISRKEVEKLLGSVSEQTVAEPSAQRIPAAKQRKLARNNQP